MTSITGNYKRLIVATSILILAAILVTTVAFAVTPTNGGTVGGSTIVVG